MKQDLFNNYTQLKINTGSVATISNIQTSAHKNINDALQSANKLDSNYVEQKQYICDKISNLCDRIDGIKNFVGTVANQFMLCNMSISNKLTTLNSEQLDIIIKLLGDETRYYNQRDYEQMYGKSGTIAEAGCAPTAFAMIASSLNDSKITPVDTASWFVANGFRVEGSGTSYKVYSSDALENEFSVNITTIWDKSSNFDKPKSAEITNQIKEGLNNNGMVVASLQDSSVNYDKGYIGNNNQWGTVNGHYVVIASVTDDDKFEVYDPYDIGKCGYFSSEDITENYSGKVNNGVWVIKDN